MRKKIVAGNWKMNKTAGEAKSLFGEILAEAGQYTGNVELIVAPPALYLSEFSQMAANKVALAAQNSAAGESGAYTGEISAAMLHSAGIKYSILGHSERRQYYCENDEIVAAKIAQCFSNDVIPIYCCGELKEDREDNNQNSIIENQVKVALKGLTPDQVCRMVIAYEPVWAIGTGLTATDEQAQEMHSFIRGLVGELFGTSAAREVRILYGGSVKPSNAAELFSQPDVDGGLIGGASLKSLDFLAIAKAAV